MTTTVANVRGLPDGWLVDDRYVYVGRAGRGQDGYFGNPFVLGDERRRELVLARFRNWFLRRMDREPEYRTAVEALRDKVLVCFCAPRRCHADVIAEWVDSWDVREDPDHDYAAADD